jgi:deazaflavin-dependent oxidoreductase (nitroreductase family)
MPLPKWLAQLNKRTFNKREIKRGKSPVLTHEGRSSGKKYRTPLDAHPVEGGYIFVINYGASSDWVQNILAAGSACLAVDGTELELDSPRLLTGDEALTQITAGTKMPPDWMNITEFLQMDIRR